MKKQLHQRIRQAGLVALVMAAIVAVDGGQMGKATAGIRINARLRTPQVSVHYQSGPHQSRMHRPYIFRVTARDRSIARRLAHQTGYRRIVLLDMRARGMSWKQIGRRLDIPRRIVKLALHSDGYREFRNGRGWHGRGTGRG